MIKVFDLKRGDIIKRMILMHNCKPLETPTFKISTVTKAYMHETDELKVLFKDGTDGYYKEDGRFTESHTNEIIVERIIEIL